MFNKPKQRNVIASRSDPENYDPKNTAMNTKYKPLCKL